jgi:YidC/Oxa1 family membrane protein insertase
MQQRNLLIFFLVAFLLVFGTMHLRQHFFPAPPPPVKQEKEEETVKKPTDEKKPTPPEKLPEQARATAEKDLIPLGAAEPDSKYNLFLKLDPLGAGVRSIVLNKFKQATEDGLVDDGKLLSLVPDKDNQDFPSYLLYHFGGNNTEHPLDTLGRRRWDVEKKGAEVIDGHERQQVTFRTEIDGVILRKTYSLAEGDYHVGLAVDLTPAGKKGERFRYQLTGAKGLPVEGKWYTTTYRNALFGADDARGTFSRELEDLRYISLRAGGDLVKPQEGGLIRYAAVADQYFAAVISIDNPDETFIANARATLEKGVLRGRINTVAPGAQWLVVKSEDGKSEETVYLPPDVRGELDGVKAQTPVAIVYRPLTWDPLRKSSWKKALEVYVGARADAVHDVWEDDITVRVTTKELELKPGVTITHRYVLYHGPVKPSLLGLIHDKDKQVDPAVVAYYSDTLKLNTLTDYHSPGWFGSFASAIGWSYLVIKCTNIMHSVLSWLSWVVPSYGLCIILLTVMVRGIMFPLSRKQALMSMKMQALAPELKKLQEKFKDDKQQLGLAQWELYRKHGVNPMGSCWVMLLQMPIFMGLYYALQESIQFRLAPFWPTWIKNLSAPDMLLEWGRSIPLISRDQDFGGFLYLGPYLNLLPVLAVTLMILQQKMMMPPPADEQQEVQQKMMKWMMVIFGLMFYKVAAGLCIYFIASSLWGFAERKLLPKAKTPQLALDGVAATITAPMTGPSTAVTTPSGVTVSKKSARNKRKSGRGVREEEPQSGLGRLRQRLSDWWADVLEQAKKK